MFKDYKSFLIPEFTIESKIYFKFYLLYFSNQESNYPSYIVLDVAIKSLMCYTESTEIDIAIGRSKILVKDKKPQLLFKYLPLDTLEHLRRIIDILENNHIYMPVRSQLNDPMEGTYTSVSMSYAGSSIPFIAEEENPYLKEARDQFHILSLSQSCFIPQLWAYYTGNYSGICLCYRTDKIFSQAEKIQYKKINKQNRLKLHEGLYTEERIKKDLLIKEYNWKHEQEWRIIKKADGDDDFYFSYDKNDLVAIILGWTKQSEQENKENLFKSKILDKFIQNQFPIYRVHTGKSSLKILLLDDKNEVHYDGSKSPFIKNTSQLFNKIIRSKVMSKGL